MPTFNLIHERWIPFLNDDGTSGQAGLKEVLCRAHQLRGIFDASPLVNVALHRLLLALLHRNFGPKGLSEWKALWEGRRWNEAALTQYFDTWHDRFDLFHNERPFFQVKKMPDARIHPVARLQMEASVGNNATLFDHHFDNRPDPLDPGTAARYLLACQSFSIGFGKSTPFNFSDSTLTRGFTVLVVGRNLFETLALNLIRYNNESPLPHMGKDLPAWEHEGPPRPCKEGSAPAGYLDYLTWQSRRVHLFPEPDGTIRRLQIQQGLKLSRPQPLDPFKCYQMRSLGGSTPLAINPEKALWRDSHALFQFQDDSNKRPEVFEWLAALEQGRRANEIEASIKIHFFVTGLATKTGKSASVALWRQEHLPLPLAYLQEPELSSKLRECLSVADKAGELLHQAARLLSRRCIAPTAGSEACPEDREKDFDFLVARLAVGRAFWPRLEFPFKRLLVELPDDVENNERGVLTYGKRVFPDWVGTVRRTALLAFTEAVSRLGLNTRALVAVGAVEPFFRVRLFGELQPYRQEARNA